MSIGFRLPANRGLGLGLAFIAALAAASNADAYAPYGSPWRWSTTSVSNFSTTFGRPVALTWSIVPDGTMMPAHPDENPVGSTLIQGMDQQFGQGVGGSDLTQRPWFSRFSTAYDRIAAVSGLSFTYEPNDDGLSFSFLAGSSGTRGDLRIGGKPISTSVIAYNYRPSNGDMVLSTSRLGTGGNSGLKDAGPFRSTYFHETLHGLGLGHVRQDAQNTLMGPSATSTYDLQFDDILGLHYLYGDFHEKSNGYQGNETATHATTLGAGTLNVGGTLSIGTAAPDGSGNVPLNGTVTDFVSISRSTDVDFFKFTVSSPVTLGGILNPKGPTYNTGPDGGSLASFNSKAQNDLTLTLYATDGTTVLGTYNSAGLGGAESFQEMFVKTPGDYYARVTGSNATTQMYRLDVSAGAYPYFWDNNGSEIGFGTASGTWADETIGNSSQGWVQDDEGTTTPENVTTSAAVPVYFGSASNGLAAGTINVSGTVQSGDMTFGAASGHIQLSGGTINLSDTATIKVDNAINTIQSVVTGAGTSLTKTGTGTVVLAGGNAGAGGGTLVLQAGTLRLGAHDALSTGRTLPIRSGLTGVLDLNGFNQTLSDMTSEVGDASRTFAIAGGAGSTLSINATAAAQFGPGGSLSDNAARAFTLDMSGLGGFVWNGANQTFRVGLRSGTSNTGGSTGTFTVLLADTSTITASTIALGDVTANSHGGTSLLRLGNSTTLNANTINVGASGRSNATMNFRSGVSNPTVTIRGMDGVAPVTSWDVGRVATFNASTWTAAVDLSGSTLDAKVSTLRIATMDAGSASNRTGVQNASFTMSRGVLEVGNLVVGNYVSSGSGTATGTYSANGTFTLNHADGLVRAGSVVLANNAGTSTGGTKTVTGRFNLNAGTLEAATIDRGTGGGNANTVTPQFNFSGGTVRNAQGQDLAISNVPIILTGSGTRIFEATAGQTITVASNAVISGSGLGFTKAGDGTMIIDSNSTYTGLTTVSAGTLLVNGSISGPFTVASGATLGGTGAINGDLTLGGDSLFWITDLDSPLTMGGNSTLSFTSDGGGFGIDRLANIDWETILEGTYTLVSGNVDFANIRNVGLSNAHLLDSGYSAYFQEGSLQLVVTPVPEPSTIVILVAGAGFLGLRATRRRRAG